MAGWVETLVNAAGLTLAGVAIAARGYAAFQEYQRQAEEEQQTQRAAGQDTASARDRWHLEEESGPGYHRTVVRLGAGFNGLRQAGEQGGISTGRGALEELFEYLQMLQLDPDFDGQLDRRSLLAYQLQHMDRDFTDEDYALLSALDEDVRAGAPVREEQLSQLPQHKYQGTKASAPGRRASEDTQHTCSICLSEYSKGEDLTILPCFHQFHTDCVQPWLRQQGTAAACPVCKTAVFR